MQVFYISSQLTHLYHRILNITEVEIIENAIAQFLIYMFGKSMDIDEVA